MPSGKHPLSPQSSLLVDDQPPLTRRKTTSYESEGSDHFHSDEFSDTEQQTQDSALSGFRPPHCPTLTRPRNWVDYSTNASFQRSKTFQQLIILLQHSPAPFLKDAGHNTSTGTRPPGAFDKHLPEHLQVKHVVYLPNLLRNIVGATLSKLQTLVDECFFDAYTSPNKLIAIGLLHEQDRRVVCETQLTQRMNRTFATKCAAAASIISLRTVPTGKVTPLVTKVWNMEGAATPDISVRFSSTACEKYPALAQKIRNLADNDLEDFVVIEVKSLVAGTEAILDDIIHSPWHGWDACSKPCDSAQYHNGPPKRTFIPFGADADISEYIGAPSVNEEFAIISEPKVGGHNNRNNLKDSFYIRQQGFAEAIEKNATFVIFLLGNNAAVALRHRKTQTFYISPKIGLETWKEGDISLCLMLVSVIVAGIDDALRRGDSADLAANLRVAQMGQIELSAPIQGKKTSKAHHSTQGGRSTNRYSKGIPLGVERTKYLQDATHVSAKLGAHLPVGETFWTYLREPEADIRDLKGDKASSNKPKAVDYFFRTSELLNGNSWSANPYTSDARFLNKMVIKVATNPFAITKLRREHRAHLELSRKGYENIVKVYGLFSYTAPNRNSATCAILLMDDGGSPLSSTVAEGHSINAYVRALEALHELGFIHGNVQLDHGVHSRKAGQARVSLISLAECASIGKHSEANCASNCTNATPEGEKCAWRKLAYDEISAFATLLDLPPDSITKLTL